MPTEPNAAATPNNWIEDVIASLTRLPWNDPDWTSEKPRPLDAGAVAELLGILSNILPNHSLAPDIAPNWHGGAIATLTIGDLDLEIETRPGQPAEYGYGDKQGPDDVDEEGVVQGNEDKLRRWAQVLADASTELGL